ncbi:MAG: protein translocase subunit SecDF [Candidatus Cardinium sp.]|uniref:protein translocase subunit SecDF n=1 Tax=Cardinium endosymbiont of Dermatophagoides farinae TaxID=2597823 RepID=UPI001182A7E7|nr:protein translocase subunit SecDF [Cardinium endosymbiont of Dermatophagoides farinae]TSJ81251.1 protein translocase subunit SecDF [Cardinium endosymbiont of Dermatophagoides farinae]UWW97308.1 MAG: protein translocase subunit SecDF [Candidatus Cardinium sp.]
MKSKKIVLFLTIVITLLSLYYLSFTFVDYRVQRQAEQQAMDEQGRIDFDKSQAYLMAIWKKPVYNLLGAVYTYEEVKERSLKLSLDLQGGMHVTMELVPVELVKGLAAYNTDPDFLEALESAQREREKGNPTSFGKLFVAAYKRLAPNGDLSAIFTAAGVRSYNNFASEDAVIKAIDQEIASGLDRSLTIISARLDRFGATQTSVQKLPGSERIQIELPGVTHPERVKKLLQGVAQLRFWTVAEASTYGPALEAVNTFLLKKEKETIDATPGLTEAEKTERMPQASILKRLCKYSFPYTLAYAPEEMNQIEAILSSKPVKALLPKEITWMWDKKAQTLEDGTKAVMLYAIKQPRDHKPLLEGNMITHAAQTFTENGKQAVNLQMNQKGAQIWKRITADHIGKRIAIALDDRIYSAPVVHQEIPNGNSQISGDFTIEEAKDLASVLGAGSLPAPLRMVEEAIMGPSLGKAAQHQGLMATAIGLGLVLLFMLVYYAKGGLIANIALLFNLLFIVGILVELDATLTLPGIAGLVLTLGMSIDANVLIFERIREELIQKVHIKEAISRGYSKSYSSIIDANITTFLAGAILYYLGQGPVRGFALVLMIGIITSVFAAIFITRLIFSFFIDSYRTPNLTFSYPAIPMLFKNVQINFIKNRYRFYACSLSFIAIGACCFYHYKGLALGVDFAGGRSYTVDFSKPMDPSALKEGLSTTFKQGVEVRTYGANHVMQITTSYLSNEHITDSDKKVRNKLVTALKDLTQLEENNTASTDGYFHITSSTKVGATVAQDVQKSAKKAMALAILGIFIYIALRFRRWGFGLAAVLALIHDTLAVIAGFCIARALGVSYEINEVFLAAILTVIGYSINDTVVIFDRIREKLANKAADVPIAMVNDAIRETLSRTVITSFSTLLAVAVLFFFGGEALRSFSFALLLGVLFGTYSSICIAAPLLEDFGRKLSTPKP